MSKKLILLVVLLFVGQVAAQQLSLTAEQLNNVALLTEVNNYFGCKVWSADACLQCSDRYFFNKNGVCCEVQGTCQQFNTQQGICEKCYEGYQVVDGKCQQVNKSTADNIGCALWANGVCTACSKRWFFNADNVCTPVSDLCATWETNGNCDSCYYGSIVANGQCVVNTDTSIVPESNLLCKTWDGKTCTQCADRTFFNANGVCTSVSAQCNSFDKATGACLSCFSGYDVVDGNCVYSPANTAQPADLGCGVWDWTNQKCLSCSTRWAFNADNICVPVADQCQTHDNSGACLTCYQGYDLKDGQCLFSLSNNAKPADLGCGTWDWANQVCLVCSNGWVFNENKVCVAVSDQCKSHDNSGACLTCFQGYDLKDGACVFSASNNAKPSDIGCGTWDWNNQVCLKCSAQWFFNENKACVPVSDQCKSHDSTGACTSCFKGYDLENGQCLFSSFNKAHPADSGCGKWDWDNQVCIACSNGWVFNDKNVCVAVSDQCKAHDSTGACTTCFKGYDLKDGACVFSESNNAKPADSGCGIWDWDNQVCLKCSAQWVFNAKNVCVPVSDLCKTHADNGDCSTCFKGYDLKDGACVFSDSNLAKPSDSGCGIWDWENQACLKCSNNWVFNAEKVCVPVSDQCKSSDSTGACTSCYKGYDLKDGACIFSDSNNAKPSDSGCGVWDWDNQVCLKCSNKWVFNANNVCVPVSDQCKVHDNTGACTTCFKGYDLKDGACVFSESNNAKPSDSGCGIWDWDNQVCLKCSSGWFFNANNVCVPVSDLCKAHADNGDCSSCFKGYDLKDGACVFSPSNNAKPADSGCGTWDWENQVCLACSNKWVFNANKVCVPVSDQCKTSDSTGACLTCFKGYDLKDGACVFSDSNNAKPSDSGCGTWDWDNQVCLTCSNGWVFNADKICVPVSDQCKAHDSTGACTSCFKGYDLKDGACVFSPSNNAKPSDSGCGTWDWDNQVCLKCSNNWVFNANNVCVPVSDQCKSSDASGACTSCFKGYDLKDGACIFSESNNAKPSDSGCGVWDWDNQVCLACSNGWVFNADKICVPVSDQCKAHDNTGACTSCFKGYDLKDGACVFSASNNAKPSDSGCGVWDWDNQVCLKCSNKWVFNANNVCVPVSDQCKTHADNGACLTCFKGYDLKDGACIFSDSNNAKPADSGCGKWDWDNQVCLACSNGWVFNANNVCVPVSDQCKTSDSTGACTACYQGYDLKEGACVFSASNNAKPSDSGCGVWDWNNQICLKCSAQWVFNAEKVCVPVSDQCKTHADNGACLTCFKGYDLKDGACVFSASNNAKPSDSGCGVWDWDNQVCLQCSNGWVFNSLKFCVAVSDLCKTSDKSGACTSCYEGYDLKDGACVFSPSNTARPSDIGCGTWDWKNQVCLKCSNRWFFNSQKKCVPVDDNCNSYSNDGSCTTCYPGYAVSEGVCQSVNPLCKTLNTDGTCASCYPQNILNGGNCVPISKLANILLYYAECCPEKLAALKAAQGTN